MSSRSIVLILGASAAAVAAAWGLRVYMAPGTEAPAPASMSRPTVPPAVAQAEAPKAGIAEPSVAAASAAASRFTMFGVMANGSNSRALIAVGGQPARSLGVGDAVEGDIVVQQVTANGATLGPRGGAPTVALQIVQPAAPVAAAVTQAVAAPAPVVAPADNGVAARAQPIREHGSKYAPIQQQTAPATQAPATPPADDGRWRPSGG